MTICGSKIGVPLDWNITQNCNQEQCADFVIKRHDTRPPFRVKMEDCDGPLDLRDKNLVLEANVWFRAKLKADITSSDTYFSLIDNVGFDQILQDDIIVMDRTRLPERMLVTGFDEQNKLVRVQRGYQGTTPCAWKKGTGILIFRVLNSPAQIESVLQDINQPDGTVLKNQLMETYLVYNLTPECTCLPGNYLLEFKLLSMTPPLSMQSFNLISVTPSFTPISYTPADFDCGIGVGVDWTRRFPNNEEGFFIKVMDSPTTETV